jgi:integrase
MVALGYSNGLRRGNLCGLRWNDVDFDARVLTLHENHVVVDHDVTIKATKGRQEGELVELYLTDETAALLHVLRSRLEAKAEEIGASLPPNGYLLSVDGLGHTPRHPNAVGAKMTRLAKGLGIHATPHMLRHSAGTHMFQAGVDPATVAAALGHKDKGETAIGFYNHTDEEAGRKASAVLTLR